MTRILGTNKLVFSLELKGIFSLEPGNKAAILVDKTIIFFAELALKKKSLVPF